MAENLLRVSRQTDINIVACTGFHKTEFFENIESIERQSEDSLTRLYIREVQEGMEGVSEIAKAGIIKLAAVKGTYQANSLYAKLFSAAANAAKATGAPVLVHFDPEADAHDLVGYLTKHNIKPERLIFCHLDRTHYDIAYHKELAQAGVYLEYDTIHREKYHSDGDEVLLIESMVNEGYASKLLLGLDTTNQRLKSYGGAFGLDDILTRFASVLNDRVGQQVVDAMMIDNPANALFYDVK
jgi:phosphotriesterase-related protein